MWISRDKLDSLENRLRVLESRTAPDTSSELNITVYDRERMKALGYAWPWHMIPKQDISLKNVVEQILAHLGMELTYKQGTPDAVTMQKREGLVEVKSKVKA